MAVMRALGRSSRLLCSIWLALACLLVGCGWRDATPRAAAGVLDLGGLQLDARGPIALDGAWEAYGAQLLEPADFARAAAPTAAGTLAVPGPLAVRSAGGGAAADVRYATLRLRVRGVVSEAPLALRLAGIASAYRLWVNGAVIASSGVVGVSEATTVPFEMPRVIPVSAERGELDLVLQVANFHMAEGGIYESISLGPTSALVRRQSVLEAIDLGLLGALGVIGLYHATLFLIRREERGALLIAAVCLCWLVRIPFGGLGGRVWAPLAPIVPWRVGVLFDNAFYVLGVAPLLGFLAWGHPARHTRLAAGVYAAVALVGVMVLLSLPARLVDVVGNGFLPLTGIAAGYSVAMGLWSARRDHRPGALPMALGFLVMGLVGANDMLRAVGVIHTPYVTPLGVLVFVLLQAIVVAARLYAAFSSVSALSTELEESNRELARKDKLKDDFLAVTSHELRTPLHGMIGIAESLVAGVCGPLPSAARDNVGVIVESGRRLTGLVSDILDYSRLKYADVELARRPVDVRALAQTVLDVLEPLARKKGLSLRNLVPPALAHVEADEDRMHQILYNLVGNAIKFTAEGEIRVEAAEAHARLTIEVTDTGIGIPPEKLGTIFDAYAQVDPGAGPAGGVGLGLAICRKLAELHGGTMSVRSQVGHGSTFSFAIPASQGAPAPRPSSGPIVAAALAPAASSAADPPAPMAAAAPASAGIRATAAPTRVLVVDDEPVNLQVVANHLSLEGWTVDAVTSGEAALAAIDGPSPPDVVLLDVMMPGLNGFEVCQAIRARRPASALPVVLLTARNRREDVVHGFEVGANDYLMKPFHADELVARVRSLVLVRRAFATMEENLRLAREVTEGKVAEARARLEVERATIEMLRYQLNPHFLLNALAAIRGAIAESPETARRAVSDLSEFCRLTLRRAPAERVTVEEELEMVQAFLGVHKTRWGDYLRVSTEVDESILRARIPAWLLQPIVENALKHGTQTSPDALQVRLVGRRLDAGTLLLRVSNTGSFVASSHDGAREGRREGIGMENLRRRLEKLYPAGHSLRVSTEDGWVHVELVLAERTLDAERTPPDAAGDAQTEVVA